MSSGLSRDLVSLANGDAPSASSPAQPTHFETHLSSSIDQAIDYMRGDIAAQYLNAAPKALLYGLSQPMRDKLNEALKTEPVLDHQQEAQSRMRELALGTGEFAQLDRIELDLAYFEHLGPLGGQLAANKTAEFINGLPEFEPMSLQTDTQIKMIRALQVAREPTEAIAKARGVLHSSIDAGEPYYKQETQYRQELADSLAHDPMVQQALMDWPGMDENARLNVLQHVVNKQAKLGGFQPVEVKTKDWPTVIGPEGQKRTRRGTYSPRSRDISVNRAAEDFWEDPVQVIGTTVHENTHSRQHQLGEDYEKGFLEKDDPKYVAGAIFADGLVHGYVSSSVDHTLYRDQLVEQQARRVQATVVNRLEDLGIKANHKADAEIAAFLAEYGSDDADLEIEIVAMPADRPNGP
ncbi:MAG: hypothetical protein KI792_00500 [Alphaproteobacteria bacterium]|nr:hypothetical protein [Alphaproteobacteria bacterium SS10]